MGISKEVLAVSSLFFFFFFTMMFFALLAIVAVAAHDQAWEDYKLEFDKHYTADEEPARYANWKQNAEEVLLHNAMYGNEFTQAVNEMSDLSYEEYEAIYLSGLRVPEGPSNATLHVPDNEPIPNAVDWRNQGMVTGVKNQGQCGSCYSFSATGALEGAWKKARGSLPSLSEQQIVDCSGRYGNYGCQGGWYQSSWRYLRDAGGDESESAYRYTARKGSCHFNRRYVVSTVRSWHDTAAGSENDLTNALARVGPVSVAIDAGQRSFQRYRSGGGQDYYLVKNSWGTRWGAGGYIKMARNRRNNCGIASKPSYPNV